MMDRRMQRTITREFFRDEVATQLLENFQSRQSAAVRSGLLARKTDRSFFDATFPRPRRDAKVIEPIANAMSISRLVRARSIAA